MQVMKKNMYNIKTLNLMMQLKKTCIIKNIALDNVDEKKLVF